MSGARGGYLFPEGLLPTLQQLLSYTDESLQKNCITAVKGDLSHLLKLAVAELRSSIYVKHYLRNICDNLSTISDSIQKLDYKVENCSLSSTAPQPVDGGVSGSPPPFFGRLLTNAQFSEHHTFCRTTFIELRHLSQPLDSWRPWNCWLFESSS